MDVAYHGQHPITVTFEPLLYENPTLAEVKQYMLDIAELMRRDAKVEQDANTVTIELDLNRWQIVTIALKAMKLPELEFCAELEEAITNVIENSQLDYACINLEEPVYLFILALLGRLGQ